MFGYNSQGSVEDCIDYLISRLTMEEFPHEIGAFLGYPLSDILGFINHKDDGCLYTGEWKVYSNVEKAKKMFCIYKRCRSTFLNKIRFFIKKNTSFKTNTFFFLFIIRTAYLLIVYVYITRIDYII